MARGSALEGAKRKAEHASRQALDNRWVERLMRFGFATKGLVYMIVGALAAQAAFGPGGATTGTQGVLQRINARPFGTLLLGAIAVGLVGYVLWRFVQAVLDPEHKSTDAKRIAVRAGYAINGLLYAGLAVTAVQIILGSGGDSDGSKVWVARLLSWSFGPWLVGIAGTVVVGVGLYQLYNAYTAEFRKKLKLGEMSQTEERWAIRIGRLGLAARGVVFGIIGVFLIRAALQSDADQARGLDGALQALAQHPFGPWVLGAVAVGLIAYGIHMCVLARYCRMVTS